MILSFIRIDKEAMMKLAELLDDIKFCTLLETALDLQIDSDESGGYTIHGYFYMLRYGVFIIKFPHVLSLLNLSYMFTNN